MGQKVNPIGFRTGVIYTWDSCWYSKRSDYAVKLYEDIKIREMVFKKFHHAGINKVYIERPANKMIINVHAVKVSAVIGKNGADLAALKNAVSVILSKSGVDCGIYNNKVVSLSDVMINVHEVKRVDAEAVVIAHSIADQLKRGLSFRKVLKRAMARAIKSVKGIKVCISGRINGAEIARSEWYKEGCVPLHTLRSIIQYGFAESHTKYGVLGVKVHLNLGEKLDTKSLMCY